MPSDTVIVQHPPAMKVGGRRLSISAKHKAPHHAEPAKAENEDPAPADYPRPAPPPGTTTNTAESDLANADEAPLNAVHNPNNNHEDDIPPPPKKERVDKKMEELAHRKAEITRPTRDVHTASRASGQNMRIGQPAGRGLGL